MLKPSPTALVAVWEMMMATIEKTFSFTVDQNRVAGRAAAFKAMTPEERCAAYLARMTRENIVRGAAF
jgi:hypothetical protein